MTTLQKWLDDQHPTQQLKDQVKKIIVNYDHPLKNIDGDELDLVKYPNLEHIKIQGYDLKSPLTKLKLGNNSKLVSLDLAYNRLSSLSLPKCSSLEDIKIWGDELTELSLSDNFRLKKAEFKYNEYLVSLSLTNCTRLEEIACSSNNLISLNIKNSPKLFKLSCDDNYLISLNFLDYLNEKNLKELDISSNNFVANNLAPFSKFNNLEVLYLRNNSFCGSLESLKDLDKLRRLYIENTYIDSGLEYLPESIEEFKCSTNQKKVSSFLSTERSQKKRFGNILKDGFKNKDEKIEQLQIQNWYGSQELAVLRRQSERVNLFRQDFQKLAFQPQWGQVESISQQLDSTNIFFFFLLYNNKMIRSVLKKFFANPFTNKVEAEEVQLEKNSSGLGEMLKSEVSKKQEKISKLEGKIKVLEEQVRDLEKNNSERVNKYKKQLKEVRQELEEVQEDKKQLEELYSLALENVKLVTKTLKKVSKWESKTKGLKKLNIENKKRLDLFEKEVAKYAGEEEFAEVVQQVEQRFVDWWNLKQ